MKTHTAHCRNMPVCTSVSNSVESIRGRGVQQWVVQPGRDGLGSKFNEDKGRHMAKEKCRSVGGKVYDRNIKASSWTECFGPFMRLSARFGHQRGWGQPASHTRFPSITGPREQMMRGHRADFAKGDAERACDKVLYGGQGGVHQERQGDVTDAFECPCQSWG